MQLSRLKKSRARRQQPRAAEASTLSPATRRLVDEVDQLAADGATAREKLDHELERAFAGEPPDEGNALSRSETDSGVKQDDYEGPALPPEYAVDEGLGSSEAG